MAELWLIAGPNGAGKTTCVQHPGLSSLIPNTRFINPDAWTLDKLHKAGVAGFSSADPALLRRFFVEAANEVFSDVEQSIANLKSVGIETVLSTGKYRPVVEQARQRGMFVGLIYVALSSPSLAIERVANRVQQAGHDVPSDKVIERWYRSLAQLPWFARHARPFLWSTILTQIQIFRQYSRQVVNTEYWNSWLKRHSAN